MRRSASRPKGRARKTNPAPFDRKPRSDDTGALSGTEFLDQGGVYGPGPEPGGGGMSDETRKNDFDKLDIAVTGMTCASCAANVERALKKLAGVREANVNLATARATVLFDPRLIGPLDLVKAVREAGYDAVAAPDEGRIRGEREYRTLRISVIWGGGLALVIFFGSMRHWFPWVPDFLKDFFVLWALATPVQFVLGRRFYKGAWSALRHGAADMNTLIAVGTSAAYLFSAAATALPGVFPSAGIEPQVYFDTSA